MAVDYVGIAYVLTSAGTFVSVVGGLAFRWHDREHPDHDHKQDPPAPDVADNGPEPHGEPPHPEPRDRRWTLRPCRLAVT